MPTGTGRWIALIGALLAALYVCWQMLQPFLNVLLWAGVLAVVFMPVHRRINDRLKNPGLSAALSTLLVVVTILGPATFITVAVVNELGKLTLSTAQVQQVIAESPLAQRAIAWVSQYIDIQQFNSPELLLERIQGWSGALANSTVGVVGGVVSALVQTLLVVFTMFYLFRDGDTIRAAAYDVLPLEREQAADIVSRTREVVAASVYGVLVISGIQGLLGGSVFWLLGLTSPLLWGVVMFFLSMIPMAGAFLVWAPAALFLAFSGAWGKAVFLTAWGVLVVGSIDNFLSPRLVGKRARLHELLIFFSVLGGLQVFGVLGLVLGPVTVAITMALFEVVRQANRPTVPIRREPKGIELPADVRRLP